MMRWSERYSQADLLTERGALRVAAPEHGCRNLERGPLRHAPECNPQLRIVVPTRETACATVFAQRAGEVSGPFECAPVVEQLTAGGCAPGDARAQHELVVEATAGFEGRREHVLCALMIRRPREQLVQDPFRAAPVAIQHV